MSLNKENKKAVVAKIAGTLQDAETVVVATYHGVSVAKMTEVRKNARQNKVYLHVLKNKLAKIALSETKFAPLADKLVGPLIYSISPDPIAAAKIISQFAKDNEAVKIVAGMFNEKLLDVAVVKQLAAIPSRDELLSMLLGVMLEVPASFVRTVAAIRDQKEAA